MDTISRRRGYESPPLLWPPCVTTSNLSPLEPSVPPELRWYLKLWRISETREIDTHSFLSWPLSVPVQDRSLSYSPRFTMDMILVGPRKFLRLDLGFWSLSLYNQTLRRTVRFWGVYSYDTSVPTVRSEHPLYKRGWVRITSSGKVFFLPPLCHHRPKPEMSNRLRLVQRSMFWHRVY